MKIRNPDWGYVKQCGEHSGLAGKALVKTANPISTRGADLAHHSTTSPPGYSDLVTALALIEFLHV